MKRIYKTSFFFNGLFPLPSAKALLREGADRVGGRAGLGAPQVTLNSQSGLGGRLKAAKLAKQKSAVDCFYGGLSVINGGFVRSPVQMLCLSEGFLCFFFFPFLAQVPYIFWILLGVYNITGK